MTVAAIIGVVLLAVIAAFQLALAAGAPWGAAAWGGQHPGVLPTRLRVASGIAAVVVYPAIALVVLAASRVLAVDWVPGVGRAAMWGLTVLFTLGAVMNVVSRSRPERIWAPVSLTVAACCAVIAASL